MATLSLFFPTSLMPLGRCAYMYKFTADCQHVDLAPYCGPADKTSAAAAVTQTNKFLQKLFSIHAKGPNAKVGRWMKSQEATALSLV
jgi:hypothetical protein